MNNPNSKDETDGRWASLNTDASGNQVVRIPLATTVNDLSVGE